MDDLPIDNTSLLALRQNCPLTNPNDREICLDFEDSSTDGSHDHVIFYSRSGSFSLMNTSNNDLRHYPKERHKTVMAFVFLLTAMFSTTLALATVHDRVENRPPLQDIVFRLVPQWDIGLAISEYLIMICVYPCGVLLACHRYRWIVFRRIFVIVGVIYLGRSVTMLVTAVPVANTNYFCAPKSNTTTIATIFARAWTLTSGMGMSINGKHVFCGDYIYSGHTCTLVVSYLTYNEYLPKNNQLASVAKLFFLACSTLGVILVLVSRGHYTIDVIIAYAVTTVVFWIYHTIAAIPELKSSSPNNHLSKMWFFHIFLYSEQNVAVGKLPVHYEWPLPWWPQRYLAWRPEIDFPD